MYHGRNMHIDKPVRRQAQIKMHVKHHISSESQLCKHMHITKVKQGDLSSQKTECSWARYVTAENRYTPGQPGTQTTEIGLAFRERTAEGWVKDADDFWKGIICQISAQYMLKWKLHVC